MLRLTNQQMEPTKLEELIDKLQTHMLKCDDMSSQEFTTLTDQLVKLHKLQETERSHKRVSADQLTAIGGNLLGIIAVLSYERAHVITSKAFGNIIKAIR